MSTTLNVGETWYVKLPGQKKVESLKIKGLSKFTVLFDNGLAKFGLVSEDDRYVITDVHWVELATEEVSMSAEVPKQ